MKHQNFEERMVSIKSDDEPGGDTLDVYLSLATSVEHMKKQDDGMHKRVSLAFVGSGLHLDVVAVPFESLLALSKFINETIKEYERIIR